MMSEYDYGAAHRKLYEMTHKAVYPSFPRNEDEWHVIEDIINRVWNMTNYTRRTLLKQLQEDAERAHYESLREKYEGRGK